MTLSKEELKESNRKQAELKERFSNLELEEQSGDKGQRLSEEIRMAEVRQKA